MNSELKKDKRFNLLKYIKIFFLLILIIGAILGGFLGGAVLAVIKETPPVDLSKIGDTLSENSTIVDASGNLLEKIETVEYREVVSSEQIPQHVKDAFVAIEDERFYEHSGVDIIGITKSLLDNIVAGDFVRGGSTITQQIAKNLYLSNEKTLDRKIKEAYIALKMNESLTKDEVLEIYLNRVFLGQNAYGVQAAADTYFSKDVSELTIREAAALAAIPQAPTEYSLYRAIRPDEISDEQVVGDLNIGGESYTAVYNPVSLDRQTYVLDKMLELEKITQEQHDQAMSEDIFQALNPPERRIANLSTYFTSLNKRQVVQKLMENYNLTRDEALEKLYNGGLTIYSTIDLEMQRKLEQIYANFASVLLDEDGGSGPTFIDWKTNDDGDILSPYDTVIYFKKENLVDSENDLHLRDGSYQREGSDLLLSYDFYRLYETTISTLPFYTIDENNNLRLHEPIHIAFQEGDVVAEDAGIRIKGSYVDAHSDFLLEGESGLYITRNNFVLDEIGVVQPQSSTVVIDQTTGQIKAIMGGRDQEGVSLLNRAYDSVRQPGSTMKPLAVYAPALDTGSTLATVIDDVPHYNLAGELWPYNWYGNYRGLMTLRESIEVSANVNAVKMLEKLGLEKSKDYLRKFGLINPNFPDRDSFVSKDENPEINDENTAAIALGGMTYGFTNVDMTAAYAALANNGQFHEPLSFTKVVDRRGNVILDFEPHTEQVISPEAAMLITDALHSTTQSGVASNAQVSGFDIAGKTGTSGSVEDNQDSWFIGYTPYYTVGVWMGVDDSRIKLNEVTKYSARLWSQVNESILEGYEEKGFVMNDNIVKVPVCTESGLRPTSACRADPRGTVIEEYFVKGTEPKKDCDVHVWRTVDRNDGLLITERTPSSEKQDRSFIMRKDAYDPSANNDLYPLDWEYTVPIRYSPRIYKTLEEIKKEEEERKKKEEEEKKKQQEEREREESNTNRPDDTDDDDDDDDNDND